MQMGDRFGSSNGSRINRTVIARRWGEGGVPKTLGCPAQIPEWVVVAITSH